MTVYVAACLKDRHPDVHLAIRLALEDAGIPLVEVAGTGNIWIRDWMPIPVGDHFVKFCMKADVAKWPFLEVTDDCWCNLPCFPQGVTLATTLILDGGNVVRSPDGTRVIMTSCSWVDNNFTLEATHPLCELLQARIVWISPEPGDELGHADGIVSWVDDHTVFLNDYRSMRTREYRHYEKTVRRQLLAAGIDTIPFPYAYDLCPQITEGRFRQEYPEADDFNPGYGYYLNFLHVGNAILYPVFGRDRDERAVDALTAVYPACKLYPVDCARLSMEGGLLHCISWEI